MIKKLLLVLMFVLAPALVQATTYYIDDAGSDAAAGTATGTAWKTWARALVTGSPKAGCGDTLIVMDGTYTTANNGSILVNPLVCTVNAPLTIIAQNPRKAHLTSDGTVWTVSIRYSAYIIFDNLWISGLDKGPLLAYFTGPVYIGASNHITIKNCIINRSNRFHNSHLINLIASDDTLIEDVELYEFHRHAVGTAGGEQQNHSANRTIMRRVYCNFRNAGSVPGVHYSQASSAGADACLTVYPGNNTLVENLISEGSQYPFDIMALGPTAPGVGSINNRFLGVVGFGGGLGITIKAREPGNTAMFMPLDTTMKDLVIIDGHASNSTGLQNIGARGTLCDHCTFMDLTYGGVVSVVENNPGDGIWSVTIRNSFTKNTGLFGFYTAGYIQTWTMSHVNAYTATTIYTPASSANYVNKLNVDPAMGTCKLWVPDGSPMKGAADDGGDIGATVLYRYQDAVLTNVPLWDPTTGVFSGCGAIATGLNDVPGSSCNDMHQRLNVNYNGCLFPTGYGGGGVPPDDPATHIASTGTTSTTHDHTIDAGMDALLQCHALYDANGNVGSVSTATSGGETLTFVVGVTSVPAYRRVEIWRKLTPTSGTRSQAVTTTGAVTAMVTTSIEVDGISAIGSSASATNLSPTPSVTVPTNTSEVIVDCLATGSGAVISAGADQTFHLNTAHSTQSLRAATSSQSGNAGGVMSYTTGGAYYWALATVSLLPTTPDPPPDPTPVLNQTKFRWQGLYGAEAVPDVRPYATAPNSTNIVGHPTSMARLRIEITAETNTSPPVGLVLYCRRNADGYTPAFDTFGSTVFRLLGPGIFTEVPGSLTATTQQLSVGDYVAGTMLRSEPAVFNTPSLTTGKHIEMEWVLVFNATAGDTVDCRVHKDSGGVINTYTVTPRITIAPLAAGF